MANETKSANIAVRPVEVNFVTMFGENWNKFLTLLGITRKIEKTNGTTLKRKRATLVLQNGVTGEFEATPYSEANVEEVPFGSVELARYKKGVSIQAIADHGVADAVRLTDEVFRNKLLKKATNDLYTSLKTGALTYVASSFQMALSMAKGLVINAFDAMDLDITEVVGFANVLDVYEYIGAANITTQTAFGFEYVENFMGYGRLFLMSAPTIARGQVIATPVENLINYYVNPANSEFAEADLAYTVDPMAPYIGFRTVGNYDIGASDRYAIMGNTIFAEIIDGISVVTVGKTGDTYAAITVTSAAGAESGDSKVKAAKTLIGGEKLYYADLGSASAPAYLAEFDATGWTAIEANKDVNIEGLTASNTLTVIGVNGAGQVVSKGTATIVVKT